VRWHGSVFTAFGLHQSGGCSAAVRSRPGKEARVSVRKLLSPALAAGAVLLATAVPGFADPNLPNISPHRHFVTAPTGEVVEVGPRLCDDPSLQEAFNQFHVNVHRVAPGSQGPAAPGLHNFQGAELVVTGC
jgi:hypothetical protein